MYELPMFPLEQAVLPSALLPLHIFEPRYRALAQVVTARAEPEFGTVLIERGREVGGDDARATVGVVARVVQAEELEDGRWIVAATATRRIRVIEWLADDPFPNAMVVDWPDDDASNYAETITPESIGRLIDGLARIRAAAERIDPRRETSSIKLVDDPAQATWQAAVFAQLGPLDAIRLLTEPLASRRATIAGDLIAERAEILEALADQGG